nr:hypothetical protein [Pseudomonas bharatica]
MTAANGTTLDTLGAVTLGNTVSLAGNLQVLGNNDLTLSGPVNGTGSLTKLGA